MSIVHRLLSRRTLIIITGLSGSGKTTLAEALGKGFGLEVVAFDDFKVKEYENYGFMNEDERLALQAAAKEKFEHGIRARMLADLTFIVEYPFRSYWQEFFDSVARKYNYKLLVINCNTRDFEELWESKIRRDNNPEVRPECLVADAYIKDKLCIRADISSSEFKEKHRLAYENGTFTSIQGNYVYTDEEVRGVLR